MDKISPGGARVKDLSFRLSVLCCVERKVQLHGFGDSSGIVYYVVISVRIVFNHGISCNIWTRASHLVPTKHCSLPGFGLLLSCLLLSKLMVKVKNGVEGEVKIESIYFWSDSQVLL